MNEEYLIEKLEELEQSYVNESDGYDEMRREFYREAENSIGLKPTIEMFRHIPGEWEEARTLLEEQDKE
jgi:sugar-specific transcriptional regulator TrmB